MIYDTVRRKVLFGGNRVLLVEIRTTTDFLTILGNGMVEDGFSRMCLGHRLAQRPRSHLIACADALFYSGVTIVLKKGEIGSGTLGSGMAASG